MSTAPKHRLPNVHYLAELTAINARRKSGKSPRSCVRWLASDGKSGDAVSEAHPSGVVFDTIGLTLSGGGVRSAATCLGALQALAASQKIRDIDYLSTVSGGGYIGCSLIAGMSTSEEGRFPFANR